MNRARLAWTKMRPYTGTRPTARKDRTRAGTGPAPAYRSGSSPRISPQRRMNSSCSWRSRCSSRLGAGAAGSSDVFPGSPLSWPGSLVSIPGSTPTVAEPCVAHKSKRAPRWEPSEPNYPLAVATPWNAAEAVAAVNRPAAGRLERHLGGLAAVAANHVEHLTGRAACGSAAGATPYGPTAWAAGRVVWRG